MMQLWIQRVAIWAALGYGLSHTALSWTGVVCVLILVAVLEFLAAQQGARDGVSIVLNLRDASILKLKALTQRAANGLPVDEEEIRRILREG
jgi:hypothetical protein